MLYAPPPGYQTQALNAQSNQLLGQQPLLGQQGIGGFGYKPSFPVMPHPTGQSMGGPAQLPPAMQNGALIRMLMNGGKIQ